MFYNRGKQAHQLNLVVPKMCSADPKGFTTSSQGICENISEMATLRFTYFLNERNNVLLKTIMELLDW